MSDDDEKRRPAQPDQEPPQPPRPDQREDIDLSEGRRKQSVFIPPVNRDVPPPPPDDDED